MKAHTSLKGVERLVGRLDPSGILPQTLAEAGEEVARQARQTLRVQGADETLVDSVTKQPVAPAPTTLGVEIGSAHAAASATEFGTLRQAPRPWLHPSFTHALGAVRLRMRLALKEQLTSRGRTRP